MTKEKKIIVGITSILTLIIVILSYFLINKNAIIEKQAEEIELQAMETNGSNSYITTEKHLEEVERKNSCLYYLGVINNTYSYNMRVVTKTFDVSSVTNYQSFTVDNFICQGGALVDTSNSRQNGSVSISKSYDSTTGILTVKSNVKIVITYADGVGNIATAPTNIPVYLYTGEIININ